MMDFLLKGSKLVTPSIMRNSVLMSLNEGHQGDDQVSIDGQRKCMAAWSEQPIEQSGEKLQNMH